MRRIKSRIKATLKRIKIEKIETISVDDLLINAGAWIVSFLYRLRHAIESDGILAVETLDPPAVGNMEFR